MSFSLTNTKSYIQKLKNADVDEKIIQTATKLLTDAARHEQWDLSEIKFGTVAAGELTELYDMITVAYHGRYARGQLASFDEVGTGPHLTTWVASHTDAHGHRLILGTVRVALDQLELFDFFTLPAGEHWPYDPHTQTPGEFERLAFHPLLDARRDEPTREFVARGLLAAARADLDPATVWLACTMSDHVKTFMDRAGIQTRLIPHAVLADNDRTRFLRTHWPKYFAHVHAYEIL